MSQTSLRKNARGKMYKEKYRKKIISNRKIIFGNNTRKKYAKYNFLVHIITKVTMFSDLYINQYKIFLHTH